MDTTFYSDDNVIAILLVPHAVFSFIATIFVGLFLYARRFVVKAPVTADEYMAPVALICNHIMLIAEGVGASYGLGTAMDKIPLEFPEGVSGFLKNILAIEIAYGIACPLSKMAVLAMYYNIFKASRLLRHWVWVIFCMLAGWGIAVVLVSIFSCTPVRGFWKPEIERTCVNSSKFYIGITVPNIIFDILTVALPVREVWNLKLGYKRKMAIISVFFLGGSVILASVARLILFCVYRPGEGASGNNISQTVIIPHAASAIETCLAIIAACLPPSMSLLRLYKPGLTSRLTGGNSSGRAADEQKSWGGAITISKIKSRKFASRDQSADFDSSFERLGDQSSLQGSADGLYGLNQSHDAKNDHKNRPQIYVKQEVDIEDGGQISAGHDRPDKWNIPLQELTYSERRTSNRGIRGDDSRG